MTRRDFDNLVRKVEARYAGRPAALQRATATWISIGMAGLISWLVLLSLLAAAVFAAGLMVEPSAGFCLICVSVLILVYAISQAGVTLLAEADPPVGRRLQPGEAPELIKLLRTLGGDLRCRPFDEVRVSMDFNAGVREIPRLGLLGWPRTILEIGLPLATTLSPEELRAVLAHEFAHLSARHGRGNRRVYRLHRMWSEMVIRLQKPASGSAGRSTRWAVSKFVGWYWPRLHARALVLSRAHELEADRVAAGVAGGSTLAMALWRMECLNPWLSERFWVDFRKLADESPEPPENLLDRMRDALETPPAPEDAARWIGRGLGRVTSNDDTHPAFLDRARALGLSLETIRESGLPPAARPSAAEAMLGSDRLGIGRELEAQWRRTESAAWRERHRQAKAEARKAASPAVSVSVSVDTNALWEKALALSGTQGLIAAEPTLRSILERDPDHVGASALFGRLLLSRGEESGEHMLRKVVDRFDESYYRFACEGLLDHYRSTGQAEPLREVRDRLDRFDEESKASMKERATVKARDRFLPHGLTEDQVGALRSVLASQADCRCAWLVRKDLRYFPHRPLFVLSVRARGSFWEILGQEDRDRKLARSLVPRVELPGQILIIARAGKHRNLAGTVRKFPGSEIFRWD